MSEDQLMDLLNSGDYDNVSRALIYIEKKVKERPSHKIIRTLVELCSDADPDIRQEAIQAAGLYWQLSEAFPVLVGILARTDEDDLVLNAALFAVSAMAHKRPDLRGCALQLLAQVAINESMPEMVRKEAYGLALRGAGLISIDAYAKMGISSPVVIDKEAMLSLCSENGM